MKEAIAGIEPQLLWNHFYEICQIPRCSKHEEKIRQYVIQVAERNNASYKTDEVGSVVIRKPATAGKENAPVVVLQSHLDMVCEKNKDTVHDFSKDPIKIKRDGDWIKADGTTLGADNGIGVAAALAVLESKNMVHGPLELLFTIDEETGLTGATMLGKDMLNGRILLNMDSEEDGAIYIGCAGGRDTELLLPLETEAAPAGYQAVELKVGGMLGGHSGLNINEGRGNAIKQLARFLFNMGRELNFRLELMDGGSKHNAIPRECDAILHVKPGDRESLAKKVAEFDSVLNAEYQGIEPNIFAKLITDGVKTSGRVMTENLQKRAINAVFALPHGVLGMSHAIEGLVETSNNVAVVKMKGDKFSVYTSQRSSVGTELEEVSGQIIAVGELVGAEIVQDEGYPSWQPNPDSATLKEAEKVFKSLFHKEPEVKAIHAGLECGIIGDKFPGMDMISFGPTILGAHSPDEKVEITAVKKFWEFLQSMLEHLAA